MSPVLDSSYSRDLSVSPYGDKKLIETFHFFTAEIGLLRADEYIVTGGEYQYYLDVYKLGCTSGDFFLEHGCDLLDENVPMQDLVNTLLDQQMVDDDKTIRIGRIGYNDFNFTEDNGQVMTGKQVKSAMIANDFQSSGLGREVYKMLTRKHEYLICDNVQSIAGGSLWASSIIRIAEVRIYDIKLGKFIDLLDNGGRGVSGTLPWSCEHLTIDEIIKWGREYDKTRSCHHIVNIICKDRLIDD